MLAVSKINSRVIMLMKKIAYTWLPRFNGYQYQGKNIIADLLSTGQLNIPIDNIYYECTFLFIKL